MLKLLLFEVPTGSRQALGCELLFLTFGFGIQMHHLRPRFPPENKEYENLSQDPMCNIPGTCEIAAPNPKMPVATSNAVTGSFKTQLCAKFRLGYCSYGYKCSFAHGIGELRKRLVNVQGPVVNQSNICRMFYSRNECTYGDRCRFLHVSPDNSKRDMGYCRESSSLRIGTTGFSGGQRSGFASSKLAMKKRICNKWERTGSCPYGKTCCFAHGQAGVCEYLCIILGHVSVIISEKVNRLLCSY